MYYLVSIYLEYIDGFCVRAIRNSNLPKRLYPDVRNGKANTRPDSCYRNEYNQDRKINRHVELSRTFNSIEFHALMPSFIQRRREVAVVPIF